MLGQCFIFSVLSGFILGLFFTVTVPFEMRQMADARGWPSQKGIITKSIASRKISLLQRSYWAADICGLYKDNGVGFCVSRVRYGEYRFGEGEAASLAAVAKYPVGKEVDVYYSPYDPTTTILEPQASPLTMVITFALGIGLVFVPVLLFVRRRALAP